jgi:uncharacterized RDD family membrane protein YckC
VNPEPTVRPLVPGQPGPQPPQQWPGYGQPAPYGHPGHPGYPAYPAYRPPPPPAVSPTGQPLASFGDRLLAYFVDMAIFVGAAMVLAVPVALIFLLLVIPRATDVQPDGTVAEPEFATFFLPLILVELGYVVLLFAAHYLYSVEYLKRTGQTVGKRVMKIRVVPLEPGATLDRAMAGKRFLVQFVAGAFLPFFSYLDGFWQLWDKPYQQCLHDKFAKTAVVKVVA